MTTHAIKNLPALICLIGLLFLGACTGNPPTTAISTNTATSIPTIASTNHPPSSGLPSETPTISTEQLYKNLISLMQDDKCILPCLMGINPAFSTMAEVHNLLLPFQALTKFGSLPIDSVGGLSINYPLDSITSSYIDISYYPSSSKHGTLDHVFLDTQASNMGGSGDDLKIFANPDYHQLFKRYSLPVILNSFGNPTQVFVSVMPSTGAEPGVSSFFDLRLAYPEKGFYVSYFSFATEPGNTYQVCPAYSFVSIWAESSSPGLSDENLLAKMAKWPGRDFALGFKPLDSATNMTVDQFYQIFSKVNDSCIDTQKSTWPTHK